MVPQMSAYLVSSYRVTNPDAFQGYGPAVVPTIMAHGGEIVVADYESEALDGEPAPTTVVIRFESKEAARAWLESPEYEAIKHLRTDNTEGTTAVLVDEFTLPG
ncbi:MAG: hypothetical protein QOH58_2146 [Thermoleophilaceae bacterium]|jgi:uncharacterized protein (DUF1330 family)|nr:hypothetical protein [Thermoleophilaceae bacterium]